MHIWNFTYSRIIWAIEESKLLIDIRPATVGKLFIDIDAKTLNDFNRNPLLVGKRIIIKNKIGVEKPAKLISKAEKNQSPLKNLAGFSILLEHGRDWLL